MCGRGSALNGGCGGRSGVWWSWTEGRWGISVRVVSLRCGWAIAMQAPQQPERAIIALPVLASRMMSLLPHPPAPGAPLPPDFASSAAWPVLHIDFDTQARSEEHTSELQSLMRISYAVFCLKKKKYQTTH